MTRDQVFLSIVGGLPMEVDETNFLKVRSFVIDFTIGQLRYGSPEDAEKGRAVLMRLDDTYPHLVPVKVDNTLPAPNRRQKWTERIHPNFSKDF